MNILITGCCGHIGSYLVDNIHKIKKIKKCFIVDNFNSTQINSLFNSKKKNNLKFYNLDLTKKSSLSKFNKIDYVVHLASMTNAAGSFNKKNEMYKNNIECMKNIINFCKVKKSKLIHISSTSVYGKQAALVDETCEEKFLKPQSPYAEIKLIEERMLQKASKNINYITYRFGTISGVSNGMRFHTAVNKFCLNASLNCDIAVYKTALNQYRPYLSLVDAFKVFKFTIEKDLFKNDIYNALSENCTVNQILKKIRKSKKNIKVKFVSSKIMNQLSYHVSKDKLNNEGLYLKNKIIHDIEDTMKLLKNI
ncbi:SDR family oxidoreductase [Candidatus Pelagibacter bacterium]|nr:SDR family oxidoreductase [Candidatus Pelagibacter bacterium]MDA8844770.1 SDR family oxidoreductase [Candidatus Pelagibacter bacterium]